MIRTSLSAWKESVGMILARLAPSRARRRQFSFLENLKQEDIVKKKIEPELLLLHYFLDPDRAFFDVGANAGEYVYMALKHIPAANIYAFEPQRVLAGRLTALFPGVHVTRTALSSGTGSARLKVPRIGGALYRARGTLESFVEAGEDSAELEDVPKLPLDEVPTERSVGCIKIDVEGHELEVLSGAERTLARDKPVVIVEIEQRHHRKPISELFTWFSERGYHGYFFDPERVRFADIVSFEVERQQDLANFKTVRYINNFVFVADNTPIPPGPFDLLHEND